MTELTLQIARDHLVMCQRRLAAARCERPEQQPAGSFLFEIAEAYIVMDRWEREAEFLRALDFVWEAQERVKSISFAYFGTGATTAEEAREILLERADRGYYR